MQFRYEAGVNDLASVHSQLESRESEFVELHPSHHIYDIRLVRPRQVVYVHRGLKAAENGQRRLKATSHPSISSRRISELLEPE